MKENENAIEFMIAEMEGFTAIGAHQNALALAKKILSDEKLDAIAFDAALDAVLVGGDAIESWKECIQAAYERLPDADRADVRGDMLGYYWSIKDMAAAMKFADSADYKGELLLLMDVWLANKRPDRAREIFDWCQNELPETSKTPDRCHLLTAMARFCQSVGRLDEAERYWLQSSELDEAFLRDALRGLVQIQVARAWNHLRMGLAQIEKFRLNLDPEYDLKLPGNHESLLDGAKKELETYREALEKIVPEKDLGRFGMTKSDKQ